MRTSIIRKGFGVLNLVLLLLVSIQTSNAEVSVSGLATIGEFTEPRCEPCEFNRLTSICLYSRDLPGQDVGGTGATGSDGSLLVNTKNGTLELLRDSIVISKDPEFGTVDETLLYSSPFETEDSFTFQATTTDENFTVEVKVYINPTSSKFTMIYTASTENYHVLPAVDLTEVVGIVDGDLYRDGTDWQLPFSQIDSLSIVFGDGNERSEATWVFQGQLDDASSNEVVGWFNNEMHRLSTAYLFPDNSLLGDGLGFNGNGQFLNAQYCSLVCPRGWRWPEFITGAAVGAVAGAVIGSVIPGPGTVIGAAIGGAIGGGLLGGGTAVVVDLYVDPNDQEVNIGNSCLCGLGGGVVGGIGGGIIGGVITSGGAATAGGGTAGGATVLAEGEALIGWVAGGEIVTTSAPITSHLFLGTRAGLVLEGVAAEGAYAFSVIKHGGTVVVVGSQNFGGTMGLPQAVIDIVKAAFL
jgi:hypothetical protein